MRIFRAVPPEMKPRKAVTKSGQQRLHFWENEQENASEIRLIQMEALKNGNNDC